MLSREVQPRATSSGSETAAMHRGRSAPRIFDILAPNRVQRRGSDFGIELDVGHARGSAFTIELPIHRIVPGHRCASCTECDDGQASRSGRG
jgi:hypothetical protein